MKLGTHVMRADDLQILPADGRELPWAEGWRIARSICPAGPDPRLLWYRVKVK